MASVDEIRPTAKGAKLGSSGVNVERVQNYLAKFGYFDSGVHAEFGMTPAGAVPARPSGTREHPTTGDRRRPAGESPGGRTRTSS